MLTRTGWFFAALAVGAYILSRGLAKLGSREPDTEDRDREAAFFIFSNRLGCAGVRPVVVGSKRLVLHWPIRAL